MRRVIESLARYFYINMNQIILSNYLDLKKYIKINHLLLPKSNRVIVSFLFSKFVDDDGSSVRVELSRLIIGLTRIVLPDDICLICFRTIC